MLKSLGQQLLTFLTCAHFKITFMPFSEKNKVHNPMEILNISCYRLIKLTNLGVINVFGAFTQIIFISAVNRTVLKTTKYPLAGYF